MDHLLVLILMEVLNQVALTEVAIKGRNYELLGKFIFQYDLGEGRVGCIGGDSSESAMMRHSCLFNSFLHKLVKMLDIDELLIFL